MRGALRPFILTAIIGSSFGLWFKWRQLRLVHESLPHFYPASGWIASALTASLVTLALWLLWIVPVRRGVLKDRYANFELHSALSLLCLTLVWTAVPVSCAVGLVILINTAVVCVIRLRGGQIRAGEWTWHLAALLLIAAMHTLFNEFLSPSSWAKAFADYPFGEARLIPDTTALHRSGFVLAKLFSFSELHAGPWGYVFRSPIDVTSYLVPLFAFFLDLPAIDVLAYHQLLRILNFFWIVLGSWGFYLYLRSGCRFVRAVALAGGMLFVFGNDYFAQSLKFGYIALTGPFPMVGWALYFHRLAYRHRRYDWAALSGFMMAFTFYLFAPHPEPMMYGFLFYGMWVFFSIFGTGETTPIAHRLGLAAACLTALVVGSLVQLGPYAEAFWYKEWLVIGHRDGFFWKGLLDPHFIGYLKAAAAASAVLLAVSLIGFIARRRFGQERENWACEWQVPAACLIVLTLILIPHLTNGWIAGLMREYAKSIYYSISQVRFLVYFAFLTLLVMLCAVNMLIEKTRFFRSGAPGAALFVLFFAVLLVTIPRLEPSRLLAISPLAMSSEHGKPYLTLQSQLGLLNGVREDGASLKYLRRRLMAFENRRTQQDLGSGYAEGYARILAERGIRSVSELADADLESFVRAAATVVDAYYLERMPGVYPTYIPPDRIPFNGYLDYNNSAYLSAVEDESAAIYDASGEGVLVGTNGGPILINNVDNLSPRHIVMSRPIYALYLLPDMNFELTRDWPPLPWQLKGDYVLSAKPKKLLDVAGADYFLIDEAFAPLALREGLQNVTPPIHQRLRRGYALLRNPDSYGLAYLVRRAELAPPGISQALEDRMKVPFAEATVQDYLRYRIAVKLARDRIFSLREPYTAIIEESSRAEAVSQNYSSENALITMRVIGSRAAFEVDVADERAWLVFNFAALHSWRAYADARPLPISRANYAFMAVPVPQGRHVVWFEHRMASAQWGLWVSLLLWILCLVSIRRRA